MINRFRGEYYFLSNMYESPIYAGGMKFRCAEALYQMFKTTDPDLRKQFTSLNGFEAKRLGRQIKIRDDWDSIKLDVMRYVVAKKFKDPNLRAMLRNTGNEELIEGNDWKDTFWGVCNGRGENWLGKILMEERDKSL